MSEEDYENAVSKLKEEYAKNRKGRKHATIKYLMEVTRQRRWKWILEQSPLVSEVIEEFPFLVFGSGKQWIAHFILTCTLANKLLCIFYSFDVIFYGLLRLRDKLHLFFPHGLIGRRFLSSARLKQNPGLKSGNFCFPTQIKILMILLQVE